MGEVKKYYLGLIEDYCNVTFDENNLPGGVKIALEKYLQADPHNLRLGSQKLHDMSITYVDPESFTKSIHTFLSPYARPHSVGDKRKRRYIHGR